ncbi:MAG: zinc-binding dehydrogenase [Firmicutes bacterium]|nr:zinc-binding dehydrogenase [Bacillota bacterium]
MKAIVKYGLGQGETELRDIPVPTIGDDDLLIEVKAAGICGSDLAFDAGTHTAGLNPPVVLGHEFSGVVNKIGKNVTGWHIGDRVVSDNTGYVCGSCQACSTANYVICPERLGLGYGMDGGFTSYVKIPGQILDRVPNCLFPIPESVSFAEAAILDPCCNAYKAIVQESNLMPGEDVVIFGFGPLGLFATQIAKVSGAANIIVVARKNNPERFKLVKQLGATHVIVSEDENVSNFIDKITQGEGVSLVVDCAGPNEILKQALAVVRNGGEIVKVGYDPNPINFSLNKIIDKSVSIKGHFGYDSTSWKNSIKLIEAGLIDMKSLITHHLPLADWEKGFKMMKNREAIKVILKPE